MLKTLIINPGSTAVKYTLYNAEGDIIDTQEFSRKECSTIISPEKEWLQQLADIGKIGIRVVHGLDATEPSIIDEHILNKIKQGIQFAPIHNAIAHDVVVFLKATFPDIVVVAIFDTVFHSSLPEKSRVYAIPKSITEELGLYRYGFHGLALQDIMQRLPDLAQERGVETPQKVIVAHLGGGASITAINNGKSVDTTMGVTPLEGLMMITRSGSIGPDMPALIGKMKGLDTQEVVNMLNNESGFYGLTGTKDTLQIITKGASGEEPYALALDMFVQQIVKYIFSYYGILQGCDALVFSGGIGYGNEYLRDRILKELAIINVSKKNAFAVDVNEAQVMLDAVNSFES